MIKYAIPACELDGIKMRGFCFLLNAKDGMTPDDVLEAIKTACVEYCSTPEGRKVYEDNGNHFNYGDFDTYVPNSICKKYGISKNKTKYTCLEPVNFSEQIVDMWV